MSAPSAPSEGGQELAGSVALVTGGAIGIGRAICVGLAAAGLVTGLALAVVLTHAMATLVSEVGKPDFASMAVVVTVLFVTAVSASWSSG